MLVTYELFVRPAVNALLGVPDPLPELRNGILGSGISRNPHRDEYVRARMRRDGDEVVLEPLPGRESHMIASAARADALVEVQAGSGELSVGDEIRYIALA